MEQPRARRPKERNGGRKVGPFWLVMGGAGLLALALTVSTYEPPPEIPTHITLAVEGLH